MLEASSVELSTIDLGSSEMIPVSSGPSVSPKAKRSAVSKAERMAQERELLNAMAAAKAEDQCKGAPEESVFAEWQAISNNQTPNRTRCWELLLKGGLPRELRSALWLQLSGAAQKEEKQRMTYEMVKSYLGTKTCCLS